MRSTYSTLMQSRFFNPAFNSAIFDGPVRIYFAQAHESLALKIYFFLQQNHLAEINRAKELHSVIGKNVLVMLYPTQDTFSMSFEDNKNFMVQDELADDALIAINGPFEDAMLSEITQRISSIFNSWENLEHAPVLEA